MSDGISAASNYIINSILFFSPYNLSIVNKQIPSNAVYAGIKLMSSKFP